MHVTLFGRRTGSLSHFAPPRKSVNKQGYAGGLKQLKTTVKTRKLQVLYGRKHVKQHTLSLWDKQRTEGKIGEQYDDLKYITVALVNNSKQMTKRNTNKICFSAYIMPDEGLRAPQQMPNCQLQTTRK